MKKHLQQKIVDRIWDTLPRSIEDRLVDNKLLNTAERFFSALAHNALIKAKPTSSIYWLEQFNDAREFNYLVIMMDKLGILSISTVPNRNWSDVQLLKRFVKSCFNRPLKQVRLDYKLDYYKLHWTDKIGPDDVVKTTSGVKQTGLKRPGFAAAGISEFRFDINMLTKYYDVISAEMLKEIESQREKYGRFADDVDYSIIIRTILADTIENPQWYTTGDTLIDSRGRAISTCLTAIMNPISNKFARSLLQIQPQQLNKSALPAVYLFIAELAGGKSSTVFGKYLIGKCHYHNKYLPECSLEDSWENIWLERIYDALDAWYIDPTTPWDIPIELDGTASLAQVSGALIQDKECLDYTNCLYSQDHLLKDFWNTPLPTRNHAKKFMTPRLYGSSSATQKLWTKNHIDFCTADLQTANELLSSGRFAKLNAFKDFVITNCKPANMMHVKIGDDQFNIECNRHHNVGDYKQQYSLYDSKSELIHTIEHTKTHSVPDLDRFRLFMQTLLIHNRDSYIADQVCLSVAPEQFVIPIHDAFLIHPNSSSTVRRVYAEQITDLYDNRKSILSGYFQSIGIDASAQQQWKEFSDTIDVLDEFQCSVWALK